MERLQKKIANIGYCSRRKAEELITKDLIGYIGNETLNNQKDLSQDVYFEGKQDDDDFEKVIILPQASVDKKSLRL